MVWGDLDGATDSFSGVAGVGFSEDHCSGPRVAVTLSMLVGRERTLLVLPSVTSSFSTTERLEYVVVVSHVSPESSSVVTSSGSSVVVAGGGSAVGTSWHSGPSLTSSMATPPSPGCRVRAAKTSWKYSKVFGNSTLAQPPLRGPYELHRGIWSVEFHSSNCRVQRLQERRYQKRKQARNLRGR